MRRFCAFLLLFAGLGLAVGRGAINEDTQYTEKGQTDFDTFLQLLNPYGTWSKVDGLWAYTPTDHQAPYTSGRWLYTEYGWMWKGTRPHSWATEHYGYWKRGGDKVWRWFPGPFWLPETIEIRQTPDYVGWRSAQVDDEGNFVEAPIDRYTKFDEWSFVTLAQFANPITPSVLAKPEIARVQLEASTDCRHSYFTYRTIDRPGPHPADLAKFITVPGMLAPLTMQEQAAALARKQPAPPPTSGATTNYAAHMTGTNGPVLMGVTGDPVIDPNADRRKVKYWVTMSLPSFWTKPPDDARPDQIYLYRPDMYQDQDGIERRIMLWFNPNARTSLSEALNESPSPGKASAVTPAGPAVPAIPVAPDATETEAAPHSDPFSGALEVPFHPGKLANNANAGTNGPSTNAPPKGPAPSGLKSP
jgi:hypothetical protein